MVDALHQEPKGSAGREAARGRLLGVWQRCAPFVLSACVVSTKKNKPELSRHMALVVTENVTQNVGFLVTSSATCCCSQHTWKRKCRKRVHARGPREIMKGSANRMSTPYWSCVWAVALRMRLLSTNRRERSRFRFSIERQRSFEKPCMTQMTMMFVTNAKRT